MSENGKMKHPFGQSEDLTKFGKEIFTDKYKPVKTGLKFYDDIVGTLNRQSLNVIMAMSGIGKTTFCQQIAESLAEKMEMDVLYYNFEMPRAQLIAKDIARRMNYEEFNKKNKEPDKDSIHYDFIETLEVLNLKSLEVETGNKERDERNKEKLELMAHKITDYQKINSHVKYNPWRNPDKATIKLEPLLQEMNEIAESSEKDGRKAPIVFIDYLQLIDPENRDVQQGLKNCVQGLKEYAIKYNTLVFVISAISRSAIKQGELDVTSARDSSNIEYTGDTLIALNYESLQNAKKEDITKLIKQENNKGIRKMIISNEKSRFGKRREGTLNFYATGNFFDDFEVENEETRKQREIQELLELEKTDIKADMQTDLKKWMSKELERLFAKKNGFSKLNY